MANSKIEIGPLRRGQITCNGDPQRTDEDARWNGLTPQFDANQRGIRNRKNQERSARRNVGKASKWNCHRKSQYGPNANRRPEQGCSGSYPQPGEGNRQASSCGQPVQHPGDHDHVYDNAVEGSDNRDGTHGHQRKTGKAHENGRQRRRRSGQFLRRYHYDRNPHDENVEDRRDTQRQEQRAWQRSAWLFQFLGDVDQMLKADKGEYRNDGRPANRHP